MKRTVAAGVSTAAAGMILILILSFALSACASGTSSGSKAEGTAGTSAESTTGSTTAASSGTTAESTAAGTKQNTTAADETAIPELWPETEMPVSLRYDRMWVYSEYEETKDPEIISGIVKAIRNVKIGEASDYIVEDYTDILLFTFPDGHTYRLEFEEENWVTEGNSRLHAEGLSALRAQLDKLLGDKAPH